MTDPDLADRTYVTPITPELVEQVLEKERPDALLPTMGGQTALNLAVALAESGVLDKYGIELIGAKLDAIKKAEDRDLFKQSMMNIGIKTPPSGIGTTLEECFEIADDIGEFPLIIRPDEMEKLEKEYMDLRNKESDVLKNLKRHKDEDILKGHAVKNQRALWDRTLELRFFIQKAFTSSNQFPQEPLRTSFSETDKKVDEAFKELLTSTKGTLNSILELQEALINNNPAIAPKEEGSFEESSKKHLKDLKELGDDCGEEWKHILEMHRRMATFRDKSVDKWYRKTQVTTGAAAMKNKLHAFNQNISEQVSSHMRDPSRMIKQMQQRRSTVHIFGSEVLQCAETSKKEEPNAEGDPELLDDAEFYQQLLKEFFETLDSTSSAIYAVKRLPTKKRKIVDRRASKSRKIRYNVHEKLVNFMAPQPMELPPMAPKLFENLFGLKMKSPSMV